MFIFALDAESSANITQVDDEFGVDIFLQALRFLDNKQSQLTKWKNPKR